jgi:diguanylate cyclase (GGDEF)-like protein
VLGTRIPTDVAPQAWILTQRTASRAQDWPFQHRAAGTLGIRTGRDTFLIDIAAPIHVGEERLGLLVASGLSGLTNHHQRILSCWANVSGLSIDNAKRMVLARQLADTDRMTRLLNHAAFQDRLGGEFNRVRRTGEALSLVMIDVDSFKRYNDSHGHIAGDRLLTRLAEILAGHARPGSLVARYGGEEFVVMLPDLDEEQAAEHAEALRAVVADPPPEDHWDPALGCVTVSAGVATFTPDLDNPQALVARADEALYVSKAEGRNRVTRASLVPAIERRQGDRRRQQQTAPPPRPTSTEAHADLGTAKAGAFAWEIPSATLFRDA